MKDILLSEKQFTISTKPFSREELGFDEYSGLRMPQIDMETPIDPNTLSPEILDKNLDVLSSTYPPCGVLPLKEGSELTGKEILVCFCAGKDGEVESSTIWQAEYLEHIGSLLDRWSEVTDIPLKAFKVERMKPSDSSRKNV